MLYIFYFTVLIYIFSSQNKGIKEYFVQVSKVDNVFILHQNTSIIKTRMDNCSSKVDVKQLLLQSYAY